jgi:hypothetical protein
MEKKQLVKFNLILRIEYIMIKKVTKEAFGGQHILKILWRKKEASN